MLTTEIYLIIKNYELIHTSPESLIQMSIRHLQRNMVRRFQIFYEWARSFFVPTATTATRQTEPKKKFEVIGESPVTPTSNSSSGSGRFTTLTQTRPQVCPMCKTSETSQPGNIFRPNDQKWGCKACEHTWRS